eukprot:2099858-Pleurochrysis_carterae.AAC.1
MPPFLTLHPCSTVVGAHVPPSISIGLHVSHVVTLSHVCLLAHARRLQTVYVFGGIGINGDKLNDLWAFSATAAASGQFAWTRPTLMSSAPAPRWGHTALLSQSAMLILGGMGSDETLLRDAWAGTAGCSGNLTLSASRGRFSDGDGAYLANIDCRFVIRPSMEHANNCVVREASGVRPFRPYVLAPLRFLRQ